MLTHIIAPVGIRSDRFPLIENPESDLPRPASNGRSAPRLDLAAWLTRQAKDSRITICLTVTTEPMTGSYQVLIAARRWFHVWRTEPITLVVPNVGMNATRLFVLPSIWPVPPINKVCISRSGDST